jgi:predicted DNA-binding transcriptional regulator AlpA
LTTYLDIDELSQRLGKSTSTIRRNLKNNPRAVPPRMHLPHSGMLRWQAAEVENWIFETGWNFGRDCG